MSNVLFKLLVAFDFNVTFHVSKFLFFIFDHFFLVYANVSHF